MFSWRRQRRRLAEIQVESWINFYPTLIRNPRLLCITRRNKHRKKWELKILSTEKSRGGGIYDGNASCFSTHRPQELWKCYAVTLGVKRFIEKLNFAAAMNVLIILWFHFTKRLRELNECSLVTYKGAEFLQETFRYNNAITFILLTIKSSLTLYNNEIRVDSSWI